jgi:hypothetical protein
MATSPQFRTPQARFSYVQNLFVPVAKKDQSGKPILDKKGQPITERQCTLIFDKTPENLKVFEEQILAVLNEEWPSNGVQRFKNGLIRNPILMGDSKQARSAKTGEINPGLGPDKFFLRVMTRQEVPVRFRSEGIPATYGTGEDQIKSGDYGFAVLHAFSWTVDTGSGISFGIDYLQKQKAGESLGGTAGVNASDWFETVADEGDAPASTQTGQGAGGLFGD